MIHGNNESGAAWYGWVPHLARHYKVVRPDMRGFGDSTPMPRDFPWTLDVVIDDYVRLMDSLGIERFHLVGAKIGGVIGRAFAARRPDRVLTLTVVGSPPPVRADRGTAAERVKEIEELGIEHWARRTMGGRLGSAFPREGVEWWIEYMGRTAVSTEAGFVGSINFSDITQDVARIKCPMLVLTTVDSGLASVDETRAWQEQVPHSELVVLPGNSFHVAATDPDRCAEATLEFIRRHDARLEAVTDNVRDRRFVWKCGAALLLALAALAAAHPACAQNYPNRPIRIIVPFPPGGGTDVVARIIAQKFTEALGQPAVVDNRAGANGIIGADVAAKAPADGYTVLITIASHAINPTLYPKLPYNTADLLPVSLLAQYPFVLTVHPSIPAKTTREFIAFAKSRPGQLSYASSGNGSGPHLGMELFKIMSGIDMVHVPYKGAGQAMTDLISGNVGVFLNNFLAGRPRSRPASCARSR